MKGRRELLIAVVACLLGAGLAVVAAGRAWARVGTTSALFGHRTVGLTGRDLTPVVSALGLVGLAGVVAVAATRRTGRAVVGVLVALAGLGILAQTGAILADPRHWVRGPLADHVRVGSAKPAAVHLNGWPYLALLAGLLLTAAGAFTAVRGRAWAALGARYDRAPQPATAAPERALWEALDRGEDPTRQPPTAET
ncbi:MAG: Trp biosynthesis-associated membrane protein [Mycobacteriales bacterium]